MRTHQHLGPVTSTLCGSGPAPCKGQAILVLGFSYNLNVSTQSHTTSAGSTTQLGRKAQHTPAPAKGQAQAGARMGQNHNHELQDSHLVTKGPTRIQGSLLLVQGRQPHSIATTPACCSHVFPGWKEHFMSPKDGVNMLGC